MHLCLDDKCVIFWQNRETLFQKGFVRSLKLLDLHNSDLFISNYLVIKRVKWVIQEALPSVSMVKVVCCHPPCQGEPNDEDPQPLNHVVGPKTSEL